MPSQESVISFDKTLCSDLDAALTREWLETNGIGGFACGTLAGANTRRYHGLLTAALNPPGRRMLLLSKLEETLVLGDRRIEISTNEYEGAFHPQGYRYLTGFRQQPFTTFTFKVEGIILEKSLFMPYGSNAVQVEYQVLACPADANPVLEVRPLIAFRDYHSTTHENPALQADVRREPGQLSVQPYAGLPGLHFAHDAGDVQPEGYWYRRFVYREERQRGLDFEEDLFNPAVLAWSLSAEGRAIVIASTTPCDVACAESARRTEVERRRALLARSASLDPLARALSPAADQFLVRRGDDWTVIAGYPWFTDWGRDTMIALPGLTLSTRRPEIARSVLRNFACHAEMGLLPNHFTDSGEGAEYNTVDASLWFFEGARAYAAATGDYGFIEHELYAVLKQIIEFHIKGTRYNIKMADDGLLSSGAPGIQLTWMDAKIGDWVVTPRRGKPVEIQALWYNALKILEDFADRFGDQEQRTRCLSVAAAARRSFHRLFWNGEQQCLFDVINGGSPDASIRPNQILAVSLHHSMLPADRARGVVQVVQRELLTPYGLRTLSPSDPNYHGKYEGDQLSRDSAYHQGTVWPWLLGPFIKAWVRVHGASDEARRQARSFLEGIEKHLTEAGLGQVSEIFDGDPPHRPHGAFAQAWSVAEVLRALCEDIHPVAQASS